MLFYVIIYRFTYVRRPAIISGEKKIWDTPMIFLVFVLKFSETWKRIVTIRDYKWKDNKNEKKADIRRFNDNYGKSGYN